MQASKYVSEPNLLASDLGFFSNWRLPPADGDICNFAAVPTKAKAQSVAAERASSLGRRYGDEDWKTHTALRRDTSTKDQEKVHIFYKDFHPRMAGFRVVLDDK